MNKEKTKKEKETVKEAKKRIGIGEAYQNQLAGTIILEKDYPNFRVIHSSEKWCLLTNDKSLLVVEYKETSMSSGVVAHFLKNSDSYEGDLESEDYINFERSFFKGD